MIAAGSGLAASPPRESATLDACLEAIGKSGSDHADLALVFTTGEALEHAHELLHVVRRVTGARAVVGCSGTGVLTERGEIEGRPAVAVLTVTGEGLVATPALVETPGEIAGAAGSDLAERVARTVAEGGCALVLPDPRGLEPRAMLGALADALGFLPVVGAVAAGTPFFELVNTDAACGALAALALSGVSPVIGVAQGCMPIGAPYVVTRAEGNVVHQIGSRPAVEILAEAIRSLENPEERIREAGILAGLAIDPAKSPLERGDFLVRNLAGVDRASGAVALAEPVRPGQTIQFQIRDARASREDLESTLDALARQLAGRRPRFGCYFNCAGRGEGLFGVPDHDVTLIRERLGDFPLVGFFGNGEFAPIGRQNFFHTYTGALVVFTG